jgi:rubrerythrin
MTQQTLDNLQSAFAGESQANRKYTAFAKKADEEGLPQVAKLFRAAAHAETIHALNHLKAMGGIHATAENLKAAIAGETYEVDSMYPPMIAEAEAAGDKQATRTFKWAYEVEKTHATLYTQALAMLGQETDDDDYYVCPFCGHTHKGKFEGKCPVCGTPFEKFERIS